MVVFSAIEEKLWLDSLLACLHLSVEVFCLRVALDLFIIL